MTNYAKSVNFAVKDTLTSGDPNKIVSGAEIDTEFNNVASSSTTKIDKVPAATAGNLASFTATGSVQDSGENQTTIVQIAAPAGVVMAFGGNTAPTGWLECDGSAVSRTTYSNLFNSIGTNFGVGDGTTTFNLPDLRDRFALGYNAIGGTDAARIGNYSTALGDTGGESEHQLTEAEMPSHTHDAVKDRDSGAGDGPYFKSDGQTGRTDPTLATGGDEAHNNMPPFLALNYIIKT